MFDFSVISIPIYSPTGTFSSIIHESNILYKTIMSTFIPINSTTISTGDIVFKMRINELSIVTVLFGVCLQVNSSTTFSSLIITESTIIYFTIRTNPNNSTTITTISDITKRISSIFYTKCFIISKVRMSNFTTFTIPIYSST